MKRYKVTVGAGGDADAVEMAVVGAHPYVAGENTDRDEWHVWKEAGASDQQFQTELDGIREAGGEVEELPE